VVNSQVDVILAVPMSNPSVAQKLTDLVKDAVKNTDSRLKARITMAKMTPEQRADFMAAVRGDQITPAAAKNIAHVMAIMSGKGGVGKSSIAGLLASALRRRDLAVGVLDADITGPSIPKVFGAHKRPSLAPVGILPVKTRTGIKLMSINLLLEDEDKAVVWRGPMISRAIEQFWRDIVWGDLDYLIVDLPPGTSDAALTVTQSLPLQGVVLVTSPQDLAGMVVRKAADLIRHVEIPLIGLVENMSHLVCPSCGHSIDVFGPSRAQETAQQIRTPLLGCLPLDSDLAVLCDAGEIENYCTDAVEEIAEKVLQRLPELANTA
jgi:Mrp family chromosome partitioning ATPase